MQSSPLEREIREYKNPSEILFPLVPNHEIYEWP